MFNLKYIFFILCIFAFFGCSEKEVTFLEFSDEDKGYERLLKYYYVQEVGPPKMVADGILFTFGEDYGIVELSGDFIDWQYSIPLIKGRYGVYYYLYQNPIKAGRYPYKYRVDGLWINDPLQTNMMFDSQNQELSYFTIDEDIEYYRSNPLYNDDGTLTFFYENEHALEVNFALNKYGFDTDRYRMEKGDDNIWRITVSLMPGPYYYNFIVDGQWEVDPMNYNIATSDKDVKHSFVTIR